MRRNTFLILFLCLATFVSIAPAQVPTGILSGRVRDSSGLVIQGATIRATSQTQGSIRVGVTNSDGSYSLSNLAPDLYAVELSAQGLARRHYADVKVEAGKALTLDATLVVAGQNSVIDVSAAAGAVDLEQSMVQGQINAETIQSIPLNGRNFLELAYLIPGNRPAPIFDPTKTNTLEISSTGSFGRGGNITIDGGDNNDEIVGGTLSNLPEDSVSEFQIATARFTAQVGRSGNSIINVVTRSGGNNLHGSVFFFERNRHLQGLPATFDRTQPVPRFDREQFGGSLGGPIFRDKAFFFTSVEDRTQTAALQTGTRDFTTGTIRNTSAGAPLRDVLLSNRLDYHANEKNLFSLRYSFNRSTETAIASASASTPQSTAAERQNSLNRFHSVVGSWTTVLGTNKTNEFAVHFDNFYNSVPTFPQNESLTNPQLNLTNELIFPDLADGANFNIPQSTHLNREQLRDNFTISLGKHILHTGIEFQHYRNSGEINVFGTGTVILTTDFGFADLNGDGVVNDLDIPVAVGIHSSAPITPVQLPHVLNNYTAGYVQDDWRVTPRLTLNLGLRYEYDSNATGQDASHSPCSTLTSIPTVPCTWMANVLPLTKNPDLKDFGPRVGFVFPAPTAAQPAQAVRGSPCCPAMLSAARSKNSDQLNAVIDRWNALPACPAAAPCNAGGQLAHVPGEINFFSPFSSVDLRLRKAFNLHDRATLSLIGEGFNLLNEVNVRGTSNANFAGRDISIGAASAAPVQTNFYNAVSTAGGFFGSGGLQPSNCSAS